jgi:rhodanese-related sulfurtransferase
MEDYDFKRAAEYFADKLSFTMGPVELRRKLANGDELNIIDVRKAEDFREGHIPGARKVPVDKSDGRYTWNDFSQLSRTAVNVVYCYTLVCHSASAAALEFSKRGYRVVELDGGIETWRQKGFPITGGSCSIAGVTGKDGACACG